MTNSNPQPMYSVEEAADELECSRSEIKEAVGALGLILPLSEQDLKNIKSHILLKRDEEEKIKKNEQTKSNGQSTSSRVIQETSELKSRNLEDGDSRGIG
ncbi:hypothetical protein [Bifidobacterium apis]|uniref:hypothetical protein n=1 Tax=Bifidobacterium apis TaxID=3081440 RepID=UPI0030D835FA